MSRIAVNEEDPTDCEPIDRSDRGRAPNLPSAECVGDVLPPQPPFPRCRNQARGEPPRHGDVDLFAALDPSHQLSSDASWRSSRSPTVSMGRMVQLCYHVGMDIELGRRTRFPAEWTPTFGPVSR